MPALRIASRYLFARKSHRAINAITLVAAVGVAVISAALICSLSVYNGFEALVDGLCSTFDPDLRIEPMRGKTFSDTDALRRAVAGAPGVEAVSATLEEDVLLAYGPRQVTACLKGVDAGFTAVSDAERTLVGWSLDVQALGGAEPDAPRLHELLHSRTALGDSTLTVGGAVVGVGLASQLHVSSGFVRPMAVYCPRREGRISLLRPDEAFRQGELYCEALFSVRQAEYDDRLLLADLGFVRALLGGEALASAYEVRLADGHRTGAALAAARRDLGARLAAALPDGADGFRLLTRQELHEEAYRIMQIEKWITFLLIAFILLIASFNVIGALSMLIIDKEPEIATLRCLGADNALIRRIFVIEGWLISGVGAAVGIAVGILLCWLQQRYGLITLGDGSDLYVVDAYPVRLVWTDVLWTLLCVGAIGLLVSAITLKTIQRK